MKECPKCGDKYSDNMQNCEQCDIALFETEQNSGNKSTKNWKSNKRGIIVIGCIVFAVIFTFLGAGIHRQVGIKPDEYEKVVAQNSRLENQLTSAKSETEKIKNDYDLYKTKMTPYEELEVLDATQKAADLKAKQEAKIAEEKAAIEAAEKAKQDAAAAVAAAKAEEERRGYDTGITFNQLARTPDDYLAKKVKFSGKVIQVIEGTTETQIRLAVNSDYDMVVYCHIPKAKTANMRILDDDRITIMGLSMGLISYESTMGGTITIPEISVADWGPQ